MPLHYLIGPTAFLTLSCSVRGLPAIKTATAACLPRPIGILFTSSSISVSATPRSRST